MDHSPARRTSPTALIRTAIDLVLPVDCAGCGTPGPALCSDCSAALVPTAVGVRLVAGVPVWSGLEYGAVPRRVLLACKNGGRTDLATPLAAALRAAVGQALETVDPAERVTLVRTARTPRSSGERGYEPVAVLLRRAGLPSRRWLRLTSAPADQAGLARADRLRNVAGRMRGSPHAAGRSVVVVDDVVTTGATLAEAFRALTSVGAIVRGGVAVAGVARRIP